MTAIPDGKTVYAVCAQGASAICYIIIIKTEGRAPILLPIRL